MGIEPFPWSWLDFIKFTQKIHTLVAAFFDRPEGPFNDLRISVIQEALHRLEEVEFEAVTFVKAGLKNVLPRRIQREDDYVIREIGIKNQEKICLEPLVGHGRVFNQAQDLLEFRELCLLTVAGEESFEFPGLIRSKSGKTAVALLDAFHNFLVAILEVHQRLAAPTQRT